MFSSLTSRDGVGARFAVVHFRGDVFPLPGLEDARVQVDDIFRAFADLCAVENDIMVMVVEHEWDVQFFAEREKFMYAPADIVVFQYEAVFHSLRECGVIFPEAVERGFFVAEDAAEVEDHDRVAILLLWQFEEGEQLGVVVEVAEGVIDDGFTGRTELGVLARVGGQPMPEFCGDFAGFCQRLGGERSELVPVLFMGCEGEHFAAQAQEFDAVTVVPAEHLGDVAHVGQAELFDEFLAAAEAGGLFSVRAVFGSVGRLVGVAEGVPVLEDGGDAAGSGAEDWGVGKAEVGV